MPVASADLAASLAVLAAAFAAVLLAELVGDKTLYTLGSLPSRYRPGPVLAGAAVAFAGKTLVAVLFGGFVARLPPWLLAASSGATFAAMAWLLWRDEPAQPVPASDAEVSSVRAACIGFASIFFSEWADVGQITTALLAARHPQAASIWAGATLAMVAKAALAVTLGKGLQRWVPLQTLRPLSAGVCLLMAILAVFRVD